MKIFTLFTCVFSTILLMGMIGDKDAGNRRNYTYAFCACMLVMGILSSIAYG